jgi:guanylate kinase
MSSESPPLLVVISGPSGAGKSTVLERVLEETPALRFSVSHTTRAPRPGETDGVQYHFVDRAAFLSLREAGGLLEWAEVHGQLYGTSRAECARAADEGADLLLDLDVQGARQVRRLVPDAVSVFVAAPYEDLVARLRQRGSDTGADLARRLWAAGRELRYFSEYDYCVVNDDLDRAVAAVTSIIRAARHRSVLARPRLLDILRTFPEEGEPSVP